MLYKVYKVFPRTTELDLAYVSRKLSLMMIIICLTPCKDGHFDEDMSLVVRLLEQDDKVPVKVHPFAEHPKEGCQQKVLKCTRDNLAADLPLCSVHKTNKNSQ